MLQRPKIVGEVIGTLLQPEHFYVRPYRILYTEIINAYYADSGIDALSVVESAGRKLTESWLAEKDEVVEKVRALAGRGQPQEAVSHARIVKRDHDRRSLLELSQDIAAQVGAEENPPEQIAAEMSQRAMQVATSTTTTNEIVSYGDLGRRFVLRQKELQAMRAAGIEVGVRFGLKFLDDRLHGLKPGELVILAGEPGVGKSAVAFAAAVAFAKRQLCKPEDKRIGTFISSLEMGDEPTGDRFAQSEGGVDSATLRDGTLTDDELGLITKQWAQNKDIPLYLNFTSMLRASQLRALVVEAIRRHNTGLVIIDHMRFLSADEKHDSAADEDEAKARFLKQEIARGLNVAVILLAHTTKAIEYRDDRRPNLSDLRGGGMTAAHSDVVVFAYSPYASADEEDVLEGNVARTDGELLWRKNRNGLTEATHYYLDASVMHLRDRI